jgi:hypothetical protein
MEGGAAVSRWIRSRAAPCLVGFVHFCSTWTMPCPIDSLLSNRVPMDSLPIFPFNIKLCSKWATRRSRVEKESQPAAGWYGMVNCVLSLGRESLIDLTASQKPDGGARGAIRVRVILTHQHEGTDCMKTIMTVNPYRRLRMSRGLGHSTILH